MKYIHILCYTGLAIIHTCLSQPVEQNPPNPSDTVSREKKTRDPRQKFPSSSSSKFAPTQVLILTSDPPSHSLTDPDATFGGLCANFGTNTSQPAELVASL
jgi:hypothetical protein